MTIRRAHVITGGFPPGQPAGHDHDYARLRLLELLGERDMPASVGNDFSDLDKWLPISKLLVTYTAGPYPDDAQCVALRTWLEAGGHWIGLHGTSGGRAQRVEGARMRRTVRTAHHDLLGCMFLTHPPYCRFRVEVADGSHPVTSGVSAFEVEDEPYFVQLLDPGATTVLLTADFSGMASEVEALYGADGSLLADGRSRALGYFRGVGAGGVTYLAFGHCQGRMTRPGVVDGPVVRGAWGSEGFMRVLGNAVGWEG